MKITLNSRPLALALLALLLSSLPVASQQIAQPL